MVTAALCLALALAGCGGSDVADVSPESAATAALEQCDANKDGGIDADEAKTCPPLVAASASIDADGDGRMTSDELAKYLTVLFGPASRLTEYVCTVTLSGRPFEGAEVTLRPAKFLGDAIPLAKGTVDATGNATPSVARESLAAEYQHLNLVQPGLYLVEITHPSTPVPARYNTATELGCEVNSTSRSGTSARFDLKAN
jgi:hypothetical protein